jgi:hypothetical protein
MWSYYTYTSKQMMKTIATTLSLAVAVAMANAAQVDIGDNEADPFLIKMINLGYIDHAPQAVYDANGNNIAQPAHSHEHGHSH